jgi:hypothetical protein
MTMQSARDEGFMEALHMNLCPRFELVSVLALLSVVQVIVFFTELFIGGISNESFLAANSRTLSVMGEKVSLLTTTFRIHLLCATSSKYGGSLHRFSCMAI